MLHMPRYNRVTVNHEHHTTQQTVWQPKKWLTCSNNWCKITPYSNIKQQRFTMTIQFMPITFLYDGKVVSVKLQGEPLYLGGCVTYSAAVEYEGISKSIFIPFRTDDVKADVNGNNVAFPIEKVLLACLTDKKFTTKKTPSRKIRELLQNSVVSKIVDHVKTAMNWNVTLIKPLYQSN
jgi:hypothetical protein